MSTGAQAIDAVRSPMYDGEPSAPLLIVAQSPGKEEMNQGRPLVGASGKLLWRLAEGAFERADAYIVSTIGEPPATKTKWGAEMIPKKQALKWREEFYERVSKSSASVALVLGKEALEAFTGLEGGIEAWRGYLVGNDDLPETVQELRAKLEYRKGDRACTCASFRWEEYLNAKGATKRRRVRTCDENCQRCFGSGYLGRAGDKVVKRVKVDVPPAARTIGTLTTIIPVLHPAAIIRGGFALTPVLRADLMRVGRALRGELRPSNVSFDEAPTIFSPGGVVAVDIETNRMTSDIERVGVADEHRTWTTAWDSTARQAVSAVLSDAAVVVMHNASFDEPRLRAQGCEVRGALFDTMLGAYQVQPDGKKGLNWVASLMLDVARWKHKADDNPTLYNALDARRTRDLYEPIRSELVRTGQLGLFENTMMKTLRTLIRMSERGMRVDLARLEEWRRNLDDQEKEKFAAWSAMAPGVNAASPAQICKALKVQSSSEEALKELVRRQPGAAPVVNALLELRRVRKLQSTYANFPIGADGCVHPGYLPGAKDDDSSFGKGMAGTGRIIARDPNVMNQPPVARRMFVPHTPGNVLLEGDWSQIEAEIIAALSRDSALAAAIKEGLHDRNMVILGCGRVLAKNFFFGTAYGAGVRTLVRLLRSKGVEITEAQCKEYQNRLAAAYPAMWAWRSNVARQAAAQRWLSNPFGRRRYFLRGGDDAPAAIDYLPQSTAADILWATLPQLERELEPLGASLLTCVHDSILVECSPADEARVEQVLRGVMEQEWGVVAPGFRVPVKVKRSLTNWGDMGERENEWMAMFEEGLSV